MDPDKKILRRIKRKILKDSVFLDECQGCYEKKPSFQMVFHHRRYIENDVVYKNYPNNIKGRQNYYTDLAPLVIENPGRFLYLCVPCHSRLERWLGCGEFLETRVQLALDDPVLYNFDELDARAAYMAFLDVKLRERASGKPISENDEYRGQLMVELGRFRNSQRWERSQRTRARNRFDEFFVD